MRRLLRLRGLLYMTLTFPELPASCPITASLCGYLGTASSVPVDRSARTWAEERHTLLLAATNFLLHTERERQRGTTGLQNVIFHFHLTHRLENGLCRDQFYGLCVRICYNYRVCLC